MTTQPSAASGPEETPDSPCADTDSGELVTATLDYDGGRQVTGVHSTGSARALSCIAGDGIRAISQWGGYLEAADVPSTMIVGVHGLADETLRLQEYSPFFDAERFAAHERFSSRTSADGLGSGSESRCPPNAPPCSVLGGRRTRARSRAPTSGRLRCSFSGSPGGGYKPTGVLPNRIPRTYLVAGTLEPFFLDTRTVASPAPRRSWRWRCVRPCDYSGRPRGSRSPLLRSSPACRRS